jgi:hypothetical protein
VAIRTTLTLDDDVASRLQLEARRRGVPIRVAVNDAIRAGLEASGVDDVPFRVDAQPMGLRGGIDLDDIEGLLGRLDDPDRRESPPLRLRRSQPEARRGASVVRKRPLDGARRPPRRRNGAGIPAAEHRSSGIRTTDITTRGDVDRLVLVWPAKRLAGPASRRPLVAARSAGGWLQIARAAPHGRPSRGVDHRARRPLGDDRSRLRALRGAALRRSSRDVIGSQTLTTGQDRTFSALNRLI